MTITDDVEAEQAAWRLCLRRDAVKKTTDLFALGFHAGLAHARGQQAERRELFYSRQAYPIQCTEFAEYIEAGFAVIAFIYWLHS